MTNPNVPSLFEWIGGMPAIEKLTERFYTHVRADEMLAPIFAHMDERHPHFVAQFIAEVFGGPREYSDERGGHPHMIREHLSRHLTEAQRHHWMSLLLDTADEIGLPSDPEFRSAFIAYLEWGSRLAVNNSQPGAPDADPTAAMPRWGWGVPGGPYIVPTT